MLTGSGGEWKRIGLWFELGVGVEHFLAGLLAVEHPLDLC